jgi:parallel beta-helix repeat protein
MKNLYSLLLLFVISGNATNYYVSQLTGSLTNDGLNPNNAFLTIQQAHDVSLPGDTIFIMNGVYTNDAADSDVLEIFTSGTSSEWITYKNYENHQPVLKLNANNWQAINIQGADYIIVEGLTIIGNNDAITLDYALSEQDNFNNASTSGNGIAISLEFENQANKSHHVIIRNCNISKCGGGGIYVYQSDYITIENNTVSECAWFSPYNNSAISMYQNWNSDTSTEIKNTISGNKCYSNQCYVPSIFENVTAIYGGNGIMIDDSRNTQFNSTLGVYLGQTYIVNNVIFNNGARGIHSYSSDYIIAANNTLYKNGQTTDTQDGELTAYESSNITFINNIVFPDSNIPPISNYNTTNLVVDNNLWGENSLLAEPFGTNTLIGNPDFVFPSKNPLDADFSLLPTSIAINAGSTIFAPSTDFDGNLRVDMVDLGAYEYLSNLNTIEIKNNSFVLYPNPAKEYLTVNFASTSSYLAEITIYNSLGQKVNTSISSIDNQSITINITDLSNGIYFLSISSNGKQTDTKKFIKS